ncbi:caspase family protein [Rhizobium sp. C4]|nr:caspase domain-containing protein [Rhizobium sp. C4]MCD2173046.1 caspase family protein [Rhizobium sp. C4]
MLAALAAGNPAAAQTAPEKRLAFVVGNAAYKTGALATPANDAGLIAQTLQAAGFDVVGARDLDQNGLHDAMRDFITKVNAAGPNAVAFVYLAGYGLQYQGDNYFAPVDAQIANAADVPVETLRLSDFTKALAAINNRGSIVVLDGARTNPFVANGEPLAGGLALVDPDASQLIAFNATPGTIAPPENGAYGAYAHALAETIRTGGLSLADVFDRTRLRVGELTKGAEVSWDADTFKGPFNFFTRAPGAPAADTPTYDAANIRSKPIRDFDERDAYFAALYRDTIAGYEDFLAAYPDDAMARRVRAIVASRREAITWRETWVADTPQAYWSYLRRYPHGPHMWDARRRLAHLEAALEPPPAFTVFAYDVPPPPPTEIVFVERRVLYFDDADFGYAPPPPVVFLAPPQREFISLAPPPPPVGLYVLPAPAYVPVPAWVEAPAYVEPPHNNVIFNNIHNTVVNNTVINEPAATPPAPAAGAAPQGVPLGQKLAGAALAAGAGAAALHVALPPSLQRKVLNVQNTTPGAVTQGNPASLLDNKAAAPTLATKQPLTGAKQPATPALPNAETNAHALPGANGKPLPVIANMPPLKGEAPMQPPKAMSNQKASASKAMQTTEPAKPSQPKPQADLRPQAEPRPQPQAAAPRHQPQPQALQPRPEQHAFAAPKAMQPKPMAQPKMVAPKAPKPAHVSAPKPPKMPKMPKPPKMKKCHGKGGCH